MVRKRDEVPEEEDQEMEEELVSLQFDEPLSWRAGKPINTGELLRRLEKLSQELVDMDQDTVDKDSLTKVAKELASHNLLAHKEGGVKAYAASCLVDILKLCAPDAPFTPTQLKDIFGLLVKVILPALWDPANAYNTQHKYVLTSLAEVKSILLINELSNAEDLLLHLFSSFFDGISGSSMSSSGEQVAKDVEFHMTDILVTLIDEGPNLPPSVLDVIMAQFLRAAPPGGSRNKSDLNGSQTTLLPKEEPEAYVMAKTVCNTCPEKMARYVSQYFSDVIMDITGKDQTNGHKDEADSDDDDAPSGPSESDFKELRKAHQLLRELWRAAPTVLQNVVPQVDAELQADNIQLRLLATETLGDMISGIGAAGPPPRPALDPAAYPALRLSDEPPEHPDSSILTTPISPLSFAQTHSQAFHNFATRRNDKSPLIRAAWTSAVGYIVSTSAGGIGLSREDESTLIAGLRDKLNDSDEKVRLAAVKAIEVFSFRDIVTKLAATGGVDKADSVLSTLADRCRDKRPPVRVEAMVLLGKLWAVAAGELLADQEAVTSALSSIPTRIFNTFYANDPELNILLERVAFECLVPLSFPPQKAKTKSSNGNSQSQTTNDSPYDPDKIRAERILLLVRSLDEKAKRAFFALQTRQPQFSRVLENFVRQCEAYNGGVPERGGETTKQNLKKTVQYICTFFPDSVKTETDLHNFATLNDRRSYNLIKFVVSLESDFKTMYRAVKEFNKRILDTSKPHVLDTLVPLLYRSAYIMFSKSHLSTFIDYSKNDKDKLGVAAQQITTEISQHIPDLFKTHIGELCKDLVAGAPTTNRENDTGLVETLKACSSYSRKYPEELAQDKKFTQALISYALYGQPAKAAKYAVNIMMARKDDKSFVTATELLQRVRKDWGYDSPHFLNKLAAVSQLELLASKVTADANDEIVEMALENVLRKVRTDAQGSDPEWVDDADLDEECQLKCWALKLIVNRLCGIQDVDEAKKLTPTVFKLLRTLVNNEGELCKTKVTPNHHKARLRLRAGQLTLKLCTSKRFEELFSHADFNRLAMLTLDPVAKVRHLFIEKLQKYLVNNKLRPRFYTMIFLTAFEPVGDVKQQIETWIRSRARSFRESKQTVMEATMGRLLSLLAHHPDYSADAKDLMDHARYLIYYISNVANEQNFGMIFRYAERVKQTRDGIDPAKSENLYVLSDLAQAILRKWQERKNWSFQAYGGRIGLPLGLYSTLPNHEAAQEIASKQFLPEGADELLDDLLKSVDKKKKRKSMDERAEGDHAQKKARTAHSRTVAKSKSAAKPTKSASVKKTAVKKKAPARSRKTASSSPGPDSADRRRSGRSKRNSTYVERDSSEDDEDMLEGVARWEYYDSDGNPVKNDDEDEDDESSLSEIEDEPEAESEVEPMDEDPRKTEAIKESELNDPGDEDPDEPEEEEDAAPPKANGRRGRSATARAAPKADSPIKFAIKASVMKGKAAASNKANSKATSSRVTRGRKPVGDHEIGENSD
ncbi:armadillo-type protein [Pseudomassariella vexata]|uniref:Armadillo-type protein n=1 Tax=Pseudomassariella vexata TaxID=1141098 RepID=A0A1Y2DIN1_9PEZI|nr:armadillo-type protein [Pseudomassariella vexata]ORY59087.1 armadillo-type protein [Pseudomassariella vexata]